MFPLDRWILGILLAFAICFPLAAQPNPVKIIPCDVLVAGGGLGGVASALEALRLGQRVCLTEITDWIGGQVSQQGVSALDEGRIQNKEVLFSKQYNEFRQRVRQHYGGELNPGKCWVSQLCFSPKVGVQVLEEMLEPYQRSGQLVVFTNTVVQDLEVNAHQIRSVTAITHIPKDPKQGVNSLPLSHFIEDWYNPLPSPRFAKQRLSLVPASQNYRFNWIVIDATETGELLPLAGVPYRLGTDLQTPREPSASATGTDPYCTQAFTYSFVIENTLFPQFPGKVTAYDSPFHGPSYSFGEEGNTFPVIFSYRRIKSEVYPGDFLIKMVQQFLQLGDTIYLGDQSLQNWAWGNDWRLSTATTNLVLTQQQLEAQGQLKKGNWRGGLRSSALADAETHAFGYYYWLVKGTTDAQIEKVNPEYHKPYFLQYAFLKGADSPMGTEHGLSRYPYIREGRRIIGRPSMGYPEGFTISETDIKGPGSSMGNPGAIKVFLDGVGLGQYPLDFHSCIIDKNFTPSPYEARTVLSPQYDAYQIPLRALIPQKIDNLLAGSKNIATSHITNAAYRVHATEWAIGAAAGNTAAFALRNNVIPAEVANSNTLLKDLQAQLVKQGNPIKTTIIAQP
ncbi:MAG: FAD-dependent oxidoreductase [Gloeobacterales cyanobacterium]